MVDLKGFKGGFSEQQVHFTANMTILQNNHRYLSVLGVTNGGCVLPASKGKIV
jgi:hypothetical protein